MKDIILDVLKHTTNTTFFECVKITGTEEETIIQATDGLPTIVLNAKTHKVSDELVGVFGLGNLPYLKNIANADVFRGDKASVRVLRKERNEIETPEIIEYSNEDGAIAKYRLTHESAIPPMPAFKGVEWDVEFTPKKDSVDQFAQFAGYLADAEEQLTMENIGGDLIFYIGEKEAATHSIKFPFQSEVEGDVNSGLRWPTNQLLQTLKLSQQGESSMKISQKGVACIEIDSGLATYQFFILANQK